MQLLNLFTLAVMVLRAVGKKQIYAVFVEVTIHHAQIVKDVLDLALSTIIRVVCFYFNMHMNLFFLYKCASIHRFNFARVFKVLQI